MKQVILGVLVAVFGVGGLLVMDVLEREHIRYEQTDHGCRDNVTGECVEKALCHRRTK